MLILLLLVGIIVLTFCVTGKEKFQILGSAGPYHAQYVECLNACGREDPSNSFSSPNNLMCGVYCDYVISNLADNGVPPELVPVTTRQTTCEDACLASAPKGASHTSVRNCISQCYSQKQVATWCAEMWCPYSTFPEDMCMNMCTSSNGANSNSNGWKWGRYG